jgi:hypothetical protein
MKTKIRAAVVTGIFFLMVSSSFAQIGDLTETTVVVPAESIARVIKPMLPYRIDLGNNFIGDFWIQSIDNISLKKDRIFFASLITGKDIKYSTKIGKQTINFVVGDVNMPHQWEVAFRFDKHKKRLFLKPLITAASEADGWSQGDALLNTLLVALTGLEYPIDLDNIKPVSTELHNQLLTLNTDISDVYSADNKLFVELMPRAKIDNSKRE